MPIQQEDIYIKKAAVQDDTNFGGGGLTNNDVVDGVSNNWFPDSSDVDRAYGRVQLRKGFGVALTDDRDTLQGALAMLTKPPQDPLVHVALMETSGWSDLRPTAQARIEQYLVKGPILLCRIQGIHYTGALMLQLYNIAPATNFPDPGTTLVVRNPNGTEQYLRVLKTTLSQVQVVLNGEVETVNLCSCELSSALEFDVLGKDVQKDTPSSTNTAVAYSTTPAVGAKFYGIKKLALDAAIDDGSVTVEGGIFTPLVPANTVEQPVADVYPLVRRPTLSRTAAATWDLPATIMTIGPGTVLLLPTAAEPGTMSITRGGTVNFVENSAGELIAGSTAVGRVYHTERRVEFYPSSPSYVSASVVVSYRPATIAGASTNSASQEVTTPNQGLGWVFAFEPAPAPGSLVVSYMAQGKWYDLFEDGTGKLSGADSSYGNGTLSFVTGSLTLTLGALPDVGSYILFQWGDEAAAMPASLALPTKLRKLFTFTDAPIPGTITFSWDVGGDTHTATLLANGTTSGAVGALIGPVSRDDSGLYSVWIEPGNYPTNNVISMTYQKKPESAAFTNLGGGVYQLTNTPVKPGTIRFKVVATTSGWPSRSVWASDNGAGDIYAQGQLIGTVNYSTGQIALTSPTIQETVWRTAKKKVTSSGVVTVGYMN